MKHNSCLKTVFQDETCCTFGVVEATGGACNIHGFCNEPFTMIARFNEDGLPIYKLEWTYIFVIDIDVDYLLWVIGLDVGLNSVSAYLKADSTCLEIDSAAAPGTWGYWNGLDVSFLLLFLDIIDCHILEIYLSTG
jgi:hypothetical protein